MLCVWSNVAHFIDKSPPHIPHPHIPEEPVLQIVSAITIEINMGSSRYCIRQRLVDVPHADIFLWRNKKQSAGVLGGATVLWVLFECLECHLLTLVCHCLILSLAILFVWSNAAHFINTSPLHIPHPHIPEEPVLQIAFAITIEINMGFAILRNIASGRDLKKFLTIQ